METPNSEISTWPLRPLVQRLPCSLNGEGDQDSYYICENSFCRISLILMSLSDDVDRFMQEKISKVL